MNLGAFSISLAVKDIKKSMAFYEKIGFKPLGEQHADNWVILKNGDHIIGLFQGMFEDNILTFNPGWDQDANTLDSFTDVRDLHKKLKEEGVETLQETLDNDSGPGSFVVIDPDGNSILIDQHI